MVSSWIFLRKQNHYKEKTLRLYLKPENFNKYLKAIWNVKSWIKENWKDFFEKQKNVGQRYHLWIFLVIPGDQNRKSKIVSEVLQTPHPHPQSSYKGKTDILAANQISPLKPHYVCTLSHISHVQLFATLWTVSWQVSPSTGFFRREYWNGLPFPTPGDLPNPGIEPESLASPALESWIFTTNTTPL